MTRPISFRTPDSSHAGQRILRQLHSSLVSHRIRPQLAEHLASIAQFIRLLDRNGIRKWHQFRADYAFTFSETELVSFAANNPLDRKSVEQYLTVPEKAFQQFGITRREFLAFLAFSRFCALKEIKQRGMLGDISVSQETQIRAGTLQAEIEMEQRLACPQILNRDLFDPAIAAFRFLSGCCYESGVDISFDFPNLIWLAPRQPAKTFSVNNAEYGKWVVDAASLEQATEWAGWAIGFQERGELGIAKVWVKPGLDNKYPFIAYCRASDKQTRALVHSITSLHPYWVSDRQCYEAGALSQALETLYRGVSFRKPENVAPFSSQESRSLLTDMRNYSALGLSSLQAALLLNLTSSEMPNDPNVRFLLGCYFDFARDKVLAGDPLSADHKTFLPRALRLLATEYRRSSSFFLAQRAAFEKKYQPQLAITSAQE